MATKQKVKSISILFGGSLLEKLFGFIRELLIAFIFGASPAYASYLCLSVFVDAFVIFTGDSALQANIVPRYSILFKKYPNLSINKLKIESLKIAISFLLLNLIIFIIYIFFKGIQNDWIVLIIILSLTVGIYVFNSIGLMILQAKGEFPSFVKGSILNSSLAAILIYPLSIIFGVIGLALSRLIGIASLYLFAWRKSKKETVKPIEIEESKLTIKDFNLKTIIVANFYVFIILVGKLILSFNNDINITYFTYATIIFGIIITTIVRSISTILLHDSSLGFNYRQIMKSIFFVFIISIIFSLLIYFFAENITSILFQRGNFILKDVINTSKVLKILTIPFILQALSLIMIQPILSNHDPYKKKFINIASITSFILYLLFFLFIFIFKTNTLMVVYIMSYSISLVFFIYCTYTITKIFNKHAESKKII